jgi:DNA invertase Pin-like site-specific DNA recombinase
MKTATSKRAGKTSEPVALAYSYIRFSTPEQAKGDSLRRQTEAAAEWCRRNNVTLDTSTTLHDLGRSAFLGEHRQNPDRCALAGFLKLVEDGKVPRGSSLIVESLDRLSREHIGPALRLLLNLIEKGIRVVQLIPVEAVYDDKVEPMQIMMAIMELSRGHSESKVKSERIGSAWSEKKAAAAAGKPQPEKRQNRVNGMSIITHRLPAWVEEVGGKLVLIPKAADAVRRVYELARSGYGSAAIAKKLTHDKVKPIGTSGEWSRSYIAKILSDRRAVGEFQPCKRDGSPDGSPIVGYFPAVVTESDWLVVRSGATSRRQPMNQKPPANGGLNNLFAGLIVDARDGGSYYAAQRVDGHKPGRNRGRRQWVLINTRSAEGRAKCVSFPVEKFERAILSRVRVIDPQEVLGEKSAPSNATALAAEYELVTADIAKLEAELDRDGAEDIPSLVRVLAKKEARKKELADKLAVARAAEATPVAAAWGEFQSLYDVAENAPDRDDARTRLRSVLRRIVSRVWLLAVPCGRTRLAAVRVQFAGGDDVRDFLVVHSPAKSNGKATTPAELRVASFAKRATLAWDDGQQSLQTPSLDIREQSHAAQLATVLERFKGDLIELADDPQTPVDVKIWLDGLNWVQLPAQNSKLTTD